MTLCTATSADSNDVGSFSYPRTGKRGVPQQFPRRLYEMLEQETVSSAPANSRKVISWSDSGKAFRIWDAVGFSNTVLPKYFRTSKFSSFQRNLNLYGFCKVRRGPEQDMYAHPYFTRNEPEGLLQLRKNSARGSSSNKCNKTLNPGAPSKQEEADPMPAIRASRAISPSSSADDSPRITTGDSLGSTGGNSGSLPLLRGVVTNNQSSLSGVFSSSSSTPWTMTSGRPAVEVLSPEASPQAAPRRQAAPSMPEPDRGRLDLLAFALEQEGPYQYFTTTTYAHD